MFASYTRQNLSSGGDTIAEGIAVKAPGKLTSALIDRLVDDILLVREREMESAISLLVQSEKTVAEGAGAAATAAVLAGKVEVSGRLVAVVSGRNVSPEMYAAAVTTT